MVYTVFQDLTKSLLNTSHCVTAYVKRPWSQFPTCTTGAVLWFPSGFNIRKTCPCNIYPLKPHFYIEKLGFAGVYLFFLFLLQNIDCGYSLEAPRRVPTIYVLSKNKKNIKDFLLKFFNFYNLKNLCILHGRVFVMRMVWPLWPNSYCNKVK